MTGLCSVLGLCSALTISGVATVHDGDTIYVNHQTIRLWGVDAEELSEPNGERARDYLRALLKDAVVVCTAIGASHGRTVAKCTTSGKRDVGEEIIKAGAALDCSRYSGGHYRKAEPDGARARLIQKPYC